MSKIFSYKSSLILVFFMLFGVRAYSQDYKSVAEVQGLPVGAKVKSFSATDQHKKTYHLSKALKKGPVVLLFYRGQWCPVCNRYLSRLQDSLQMVYEKGATVIAVSPEKPDYLQKTASKTKATFTLLYDKDYAISEAFNVVFMPTEKEIAVYNERLQADLAHSHSDSSQRLPVPATFIINKKGVIIWRQFNPDYRIRASVKEILDNIPVKK